MTKNALLMFSDKTNIELIGNRLLNLGYTMYGSQGTAKALNLLAVPVIDIATLVGDPLINHKVVSLSREIHAGLLALTLEEITEIEAKEIIKFDLVLIDLYPLEKTIEEFGNKPEKVRDQTDIGGPTAASSAAKGKRIIGIEVWQREIIIDWLEKGCPDEENFLISLEAHVNYVVSRYRGLSAKYLGGENYFISHGILSRKLKYGENPHQKWAAMYETSDNDPLAFHKFEIAYGNVPGFVNTIDASRAMEAVTSISAAFDYNGFLVPNICVGVKHGNACGAAFHQDKVSAIENMLLGDLDAIMGGVVACNFDLGAHQIQTLFQSYATNKKGWRLLAGIICTGISEFAKEKLREKGASCFVLVNDNFSKENLDRNSLNKKQLQRDLGRGTILVQDASSFIPKLNEATIHGMTTGYNQEKYQNLLLAWGICVSSNSNTITIVHKGKLLGNGVGQQSRVRGAKLGIANAYEGLERSNNEMRHNHFFLKGAVAWSDSFFPFADGIEVLTNKGIKTIGGTMGSKNDQKIIEFCEESNIEFYSFPDPIGRAFSNH